jgi:hypothetical protein
MRVERSGWNRGCALKSLWQAFGAELDGVGAGAGVDRGLQRHRAALRAGLPVTPRVPARSSRESSGASQSASGNGGQSTVSLTQPCLPVPCHRTVARMPMARRHGGSTAAARRSPIPAAQSGRRVSWRQASCRQRSHHRRDCPGCDREHQGPASSRSHSGQFSSSRRLVPAGAHSLTIFTLYMRGSELPSFTIIRVRIDAPGSKRFSGQAVRR